MSVKRDPDGRRSVQVEVEVPGTPEQVWQAIGTGPGISAWFVPSTVDEEGGELTSDFGGGMEMKAKITAFEAPHRFVAETPGWSEGMPPIATEWTVEAKTGDTCVVRVVHSLFADTDDWDTQIEHTEKGWPAYFHVLRRYLEQFAGEPSAQIMGRVMSEKPVEDLWPAFAEAFQVPNEATGQSMNVEVAPGVSLSGTVARVVPTGPQRSVIFDLDAPVQGTLYVGVFPAGGSMISLQCYLYGANAEMIGSMAQPAVQAWLDATFGAPVE